MTGQDQETRQALLAAVARVRPEIERAAVEGESLMTLPAASVDLLAESGLLRIKLPAALGGFEADLPTQFEVIEAMAYVDAAAGWCLMIGATCIAVPGAWLPDAAVQEMFQGPRPPRGASTIAPSGTAHPTEGGYRLTGRWSFASGVRHSDWLSMGALVPDPGADRPRHLMFALPTSRARIHDNWDTIGLRGTGSCDVSVEDLFIPTGFAFDVLAGEPARGGPLYRLGFPAFVAYEHAALALGVARRALDALLELAPGKMRGMPPSPLIARGAFQRDLGEIDLRLRAARGLALDRNREAWATICAGSRLDARLQAELRAAAVYATDVAVEVATWAYRQAGGSAVYKPNLLERSVRDLYTATQHFMVSDAAYEAHGQSLLGTTALNPLG
jgi:alkylation response protein AidB-like acyl-CoA dehydrogenase